MDTGKKETTEFFDLCAICGHDIDSTVNIDGDKHAACRYSLNPSNIGSGTKYHFICTYGGCMPDMDYRNKTGQYEE